MATSSISFEETPLLGLTLARADDALILGHRLSEWSGKAPLLEEDIALTNIALDLIGQARMLYGYAADQTGGRYSEDDFAFLRDSRQFKNCLLVEQPNGDFAATIVRQLFVSAFMLQYWRAMMASKDETLAAIAAKAEKECAYHLRHASQWVIRLGDGTADSEERTDRAVRDLWMYTGELFEISENELQLIDAGIAAAPSSLRAAWIVEISRVFRQAAIAVPSDGWMQTGGRSGRHSEHLGHLLPLMQILPRTYPGAVW